MYSNKKHKDTFLSEESNINPSGLIGPVHHPAVAGSSPVFLATKAYEDESLISNFCIDDPN